jgi:hypothetical protein
MLALTRNQQDHQATCHHKQHYLFSLIPGLLITKTCHSHNAISQVKQRSLIFVNIITAVEFSCCGISHQAAFLDFVLCGWDWELFCALFHCNVYLCPLKSCCSLTVGCWFHVSNWLWERYKRTRWYVLINNSYTNDKIQYSNTFIQKNTLHTLHLF